MKDISLFLMFFLLLNCEQKVVSSTQVVGETDAVYEKPGKVEINREKNTIIERFQPPQGFTWITSEENSYGNFIEHFPLKSYGSPIVKFNSEPVANQNLREGVFDLDVGTRDLQQCADAVIRMRSEFLFKTRKFDEIKFHFTSGDLLTWNDYREGVRAFVNGNKVTFRKAETRDDSYGNFIKYLELVYNYAGTISQFRETKPLKSNADLRTGDLLITAGSPGHVVFIAGTCKNEKGEKRYLLAEGFTPAQSISIMSNPFDPKISPWYELDVNAAEIRTSRYRFQPVNFRRY